jgi:hypothetical protein
MQDQTTEGSIGSGPKIRKAKDVKRQVSKALETKQQEIVTVSIFAYLNHLIVVVNTVQRRSGYQATGTTLITI